VKRVLDGVFAARLGFRLRPYRHVFSEVAEVPVLTDSDDSIVDVSTIKAASEAPLGLARRVLGRLAMRNAVASRVSARLSEEVSLAVVGDRPVVLVIGGGNVGRGLDKLYDDPKLDVLGATTIRTRERVVMYPPFEPCKVSCNSR